MAIRVEVSGLKRRPFARFKFPAVSKEWAESVGPLVQDALRQAAPVAKVNGGRLKKSIRYEARLGAASAQLEFSTTVPYAGFVLKGTPAHTIRPNTKRALFWPGAAHPVAQVNHPGTRANKFPERAISPLKPVIQGRFKRIVQTALEE